VKRFEYGIGSKFSKYPAPCFANDEIGLRGLWTAVWQGRWFVQVITEVFTIGLVFYALSAPCASA